MGFFPMRSVIFSSFAYWLFAWAAVTATAVQAQPFVVKDDWGRELVFAQVPTRIVSLSAHLTELAREAGLESSLVAVDLHSSAKKTLPRLSAYPEPAAEAVLKLKPDLVLVWGAGLKKVTVDRLEKLGARVFVSEPKVLEDIVTTLTRLAAISNRSEFIAKRVEELHKTLSDTVAEKASRSARSIALVPVFVQVWQQPLMTLGTKTFLGDALSYCGVQAVLAPNTSGTALINPEAVLNADPRVIVTSDVHQAQAYWKLRANQQDLRWEFIALPDSVLSRPSAKLIDALPLLCKRLSLAR
jgi:iron complex transport system substrate-binding protein